MSVEDQPTADERVPVLLNTPAAVRFVSYEPALSAVNFNQWENVEGLNRGDDIKWLNLIDLVIIGGESGPRARSFDLGWARKTIADCKAAGTACFVKQLGARAYFSPPEDCGTGYFVPLKHKAGADPTEWAADLQVQEFPK